MSNIYPLKFDGYRVAERLLEGVYFAVHVEIEGDSAEIKDVTPWDEENAAYLAQFNLNHFIPLIKQAVQHNIDYLKNYYAENGGDFESDMADWTAESGEAGIQILLEV